MHYFTKFRFVFGISIVASILSKFRPRSDRSGKVDKSVFCASSHHVKLQFLQNHSSSVWSWTWAVFFSSAALIRIQLGIWVLETNNIIFADPDHNQLEKVICLWYFETFVNFFDICLHSSTSKHQQLSRIFSGIVITKQSWQNKSPFFLTNLFAKEAIQIPSQDAKTVSFQFPCALSKCTSCLTWLRVFDVCFLTTNPLSIHYRSLVWL